MLMGKPLELREITIFLLLIVTSIFSQVLCIKYFSLPLLSIIIILLILVYLLIKAKNFNFYSYLFLLSIFSFIVINDSFNYVLTNVILQDIPLFIITIFVGFNYLYTGNFKIDSISKNNTIFYVFLIYFTFSFVRGVFSSNNIFHVFYEYYNFLYFVLPIVFIRAFNQSRYYDYFVRILIFLSVILALEYIFGNLFLGTSKRFTSFHAGFFPIPIAIVFSRFLDGNWKTKIFNIILLLILILGTFLTQTRSLWGAVIISIIFTSGYYFYSRKWYKFLVFFSTVAIIYLLMQSEATTSQINTPKETNIETRTEALSNPTGDVSLLMRFEIGYYIYLRFLENPLAGDGLGATMVYQLFSKTRINYPDNSFLYVMWKGGILGLIIYLGIFILTIKKAHFLIKATDSLYKKQFMIGIVAGIVGMLFFSLFASTLIKYPKLNLIIAFLISYVFFERSKVGN